MAKISSYEDYSLDDQTEVSSSEKEKFEDTGVIPVSGQYETNGDKKTKSVKLKDLLTSGGGLPEYDGADINKVLTVVNSKKIDWIEPGLTPDHVYGENGIYVSSGSASVNVSISTSGASDGDVLTYNGTTQKVAWAAPSGGGGGGMTMGTSITITDAMINLAGDEYGSDNWVDIDVVNNTYTELIIPSTLTKQIGYIKFNITTPDMPNFIYHVKNQDNSRYEYGGPAAEVHYKANASDTDVQFDHYVPLNAAYNEDREHAPLLYGANGTIGNTGEAILTCIGRYFEIKLLATHVPPSGSWNGVFS